MGGIHADDYIHKSTLRSDLGEISHPKLIGPDRDKLLLDQVGRALLLWIADGSALLLTANNAPKST